MSLLAIVQSFALVVTFVLVWVSIEVAEDLRSSGFEERTRDDA